MGISYLHLRVSSCVVVSRGKVSYCWWKKSQTTHHLDVKNLANNWINCVSTGAECLPARVVSLHPPNKWTNQYLILCSHNHRCHPIKQPAQKNNNLTYSLIPAWTEECITHETIHNLWKLHVLGNSRFQDTQGCLAACSATYSKHVAIANCSRKHL